MESWITLRQLETRLGVRLFKRTTRSGSPTEAGALLHANLLSAVASLEAAVSNAVELHRDPVGTIRLNLPRLAAELVVIPRLADFLAQFSRVKMEMVIDDSLSDVVEKGFDAGIWIGDRPAQDKIALPLTPPYRIAVVGEPEYLRHNVAPQTPHDLSRHRCIGYRWAETGELARWHFRGPDGRFEVNVEGAVVLNDTGRVRGAAVRGIGSAYLPEAAVEQLVAPGALVRVLETSCEPVPGFFLYYPGSRQLPPGLRVLIDFLRKENLQVN